MKKRVVKHVKHGYSRRGSRIPEYGVWGGIIQRCTNGRRKEFTDYGDRGISICPQWRNFTQFYVDMGPRPSPNHSIERIDNERGYEPGNCRWATRLEQNNNSRHNRLVIYRGQEMSLSNAMRIAGSTASFAAIRSRLKSGWPVHEALEKPPNLRAPRGKWSLRKKRKKK